jgi:hypothetical protein
MVVAAVLAITLDPALQAVVDARPPARFWPRGSASAPTQSRRHDFPLEDGIPSCRGSRAPTSCRIWVASHPRSFIRRAVTAMVVTVRSINGLVREFMPR